jgi:hypothetical protein
MCFIALTHRMDGDHVGAGRLGNDLVDLGERHGFTAWQLAGAIQSGFTAAREGDAAALDRLVRDVSLWRTALASDLWTPYWLTELAGAQRRSGHHDAALRSLDEALSVSSATGATFYVAETLRVRGEVRRDRGDPGGISDLRAAHEVAMSQGAELFAHRAKAVLDRITLR